MAINDGDWREVGGGEGGIRTRGTVHPYTRFPSVLLKPDGLYCNVRFEDARLCLLVLIGARADGKKELIAVEDGYRESEQSWWELLRDLHSRTIPNWRRRWDSNPRARLITEQPDFESGPLRPLRYSSTREGFH